MSDRGGWRPIPTHLRPLRDKLRVAGFDLIHLSDWEAADRARRYVGHEARDYDYTIYPIAHIDEGSGQVFLLGSLESSHYFSETSAPSAIESHLEHNAPAPLRRWLFKWLRDSNTGRALGITTLLAPPSGLTILGAIGIGNWQSVREAKHRARLLPRLLDMPKFR